MDRWVKLGDDERAKWLSQPNGANSVIEFRKDRTEVRLGP
jgi:hypothetical protein